MSATLRQSARVAALDPDAVRLAVEQPCGGCETRCTLGFRRRPAVSNITLPGRFSVASSGKIGSRVALLIDGRAMLAAAAVLFGPTIVVIALLGAAAELPAGRPELGWPFVLLTITILGLTLFASARAARRVAHGLGLRVDLLHTAGIDGAGSGSVQAGIDAPVTRQ